MKTLSLLPLLFLVTSSVVFALPGPPGQDLSSRDIIDCVLKHGSDSCYVAPEKACSGSRTKDDVCDGKKLQKQNSFHNCKNSGGKCCAANADGSGGLAVGGGLGREDCGYCFSGKCFG